jgi:hypothetical protein
VDRPFFLGIALRYLRKKKKRTGKRVETRLLYSLFDWHFFGTLSSSLGLEDKRMKETKTIDAAPNQADEIINLEAHFGWELVSNQRVMSHSQDFTGRTVDDLTNTITDHYTTTDVNFIQLTFQRDMTLPAYERIKENEKKYVDLQAELDRLSHQLRGLENQNEKDKKDGSSVFYSILLAIVNLIATGLNLFFYFKGPQVFLMVFAVIFGLLSLIFLIVIPSDKKEDKKKNERMANYEKDKKALLEQCAKARSDSDFLFSYTRALVDEPRR